jgi:proteasome lid subunit RPN8/RPN11
MLKAQRFNFLRITRRLRDEIVAHAISERPNESCGFLLGTGDLLDELVPAHNVLQSPTRFLIDPADHFAAIRRARVTGREVRAAYHSHPRGPSEPSPTDAAELTEPSLVYIIVSLALEPPSVAAFEWHDGNFVAIQLVPVP